MDSPIQSEHPVGQGSIRGVLPLLLMALALVIWFSFQLFQSLKTKDALEQAFTAQETPVQNATKVRKSLSALALATKQLAGQGNPNAATVVSNLAARGINIDDQQAPQAPQTKP